MKNLKIKRWICDGDSLESSGSVHDTDSLLEAASDIMDSAETWEIMGEILFEAEDGKFYVGTVNFCIDEANPEYVNDVLAREQESD